MQESPLMAARITPAEAEPPELVQSHPGVPDGEAQPAFGETFFRWRRDCRVCLGLPGLPGGVHLAQAPKLVHQAVMAVERLPGWRLLLRVWGSQRQGFGHTQVLHGAPSVVAPGEGPDQAAPGAFCLCRFAELLVAKPQPEQPPRLQRWRQGVILIGAFQQGAGTIPISSQKCLAGEVPLELPDVGVVGPAAQGGIRPIAAGESHASCCNSG